MTPTIWFICGLIGSLWLLVHIKNMIGYLTIGDFVVGFIGICFGPGMIGTMFGITIGNIVSNCKCEWMDKKIL